MKATKIVALLLLVGTSVAFVPPASAAQCNVSSFDDIQKCVTDTGNMAQGLAQEAVCIVQDFLNDPCD